MALRSCLVSCRDLAGTEHAVEVTAESLYEAVAQALGILRGDQWVEEMRGVDGVEGARQAARRRAPGQDEGFQAVAGESGEDAGRVYEEEEVDGAGERGRAGTMIRSRDWPACLSARVFWRHMVRLDSAPLSLALRVRRSSERPTWSCNVDSARWWSSTGRPIAHPALR